MFDFARKHEYWQLFRYYQAGLVNMAFGYVVFALLVWLGLQVFAAQAVGHVLGVAFNYFTYSRFAFTGQKASKPNFVLAYVGNYFLGLFFLWLALKVFPSPYISGGVATVAVSMISYFVLKRLVFRPPAEN